MLAVQIPIVQCKVSRPSIGLVSIKLTDRRVHFILCTDIHLHLSLSLCCSSFAELVLIWTGFCYENTKIPPATFIILNISVTLKLIEILSNLMVQVLMVFYSSGILSSNLVKIERCTGFYVTRIMDSHLESKLPVLTSIFNLQGSC